jgi:large subunit ribosomal protein L1
MSFEPQKLADNIHAMMNQIHRLKPQTSKGAYVKKIVLKGSMTPAVYLQDVAH